MIHLRRVSIPRALWMILIAALALRILAILADASFGLFVQPPISSSHNERALALAQGWLDGRFLVPLGQRVPPGLKTDPRRVFVAYVLAPFYILLSLSPLAGRIGIAVYGTALGGVAYALAREIALGKRPALLAAGLTAFWPSIVYRSIVIQREVFAALAFLAAVWVALRWVRAPVFALSPRIRTAEGVLLTTALVLLYVLRIENLLVIAVVFVVAFAVRYRAHTRTLVATGAAAAIGLGVVVTNLAWFIGAPARNNPNLPAILDAYVFARANGTSLYLMWLHYDSWFDLVVFAPLKVVYYLSSPMPWQVNSVADLLAALSGAALMIASAFSIVGVMRALRDAAGVEDMDWRAVAVLAAFLIVGVVTYAIVEINAGAAFRRRIQFVPAVLVLAVVGIYRIR